jgi:hypothetical protein
LGTLLAGYRRTAFPAHLSESASVPIHEKQLRRVCSGVSWKRQRGNWKILRKSRANQQKE